MFFLSLPISFTKEDKRTPNSWNVCINNANNDELSEIGQVSQIIGYPAMIIITVNIMMMRWDGGKDSFSVKEGSLINADIENGDGLRLRWKGF